jgi:DNA repair protein RadC
MKAVIRVPTVQFGYIEIEMENKIGEGFANLVIDAHNDMVKKYELRKGEIQQLKDDNF